MWNEMKNEKKSPLAKHRENFHSWIDLVKKACLTWYWAIFLLQSYFYDKTIFHLMLLLVIIRPENKIPVFLAKAGEKHVVFQLFQPHSEKDSFSSSSSISSRSGHTVQEHQKSITSNFLRSLDDLKHGKHLYQDLQPIRKNCICQNKVKIQVFGSTKSKLQIHV